MEESEAPAPSAAPGISTEEAAIRIQGLARGANLRRKGVLETKRQEKEKKIRSHEAATEIQRHMRGFHMRKKLSQKDKDISKMQFRERHEAEGHIKVEELHKSATEVMHEKKLEEADRSIIEQARVLKEHNAGDKQELKAAVKIQSMYRGFSTRSQRAEISKKRSETEEQFRQKRQAEAAAEEQNMSKLFIPDKHVADDAVAIINDDEPHHRPSSSSHQAHQSEADTNENSASSSNIEPHHHYHHPVMMGVASLSDHLMPDGDRPSKLATRQKILAKNRMDNRLEATELSALKYQQDPVVPDILQVQAMNAIREATKNWSRKYVMHIEPAAGSASADEIMRFCSMWSTPVLYRPVPRTIIHVHFSVPREKVLAGNTAGAITFRVENQVLERTIGVTRGIGLQESWLDRVIMDKEKLRASFKLAA